MTHALIGPIENPVETNIVNVLTVAEASYRWGISEGMVKTRLRINNSSEEKLKELRYLEEIGYIKYFKPYEERNGKEARGTWLLTKEVMKLWFGEPVHTERISSI